MNLQEAIELFMNESSEKWDTPNRALNQCVCASFEFRDFLRKHGIDCKIWNVTLVDEYDRFICPEVYPSPLPNYVCEGHCIVLVDDVAVDWTARQYNPDAPYPHVFTPKFGGDRLKYLEAEEARLQAQITEIQNRKRSLQRVFA